MESRLEKLYKTKLRGELQKKLGLKNVMQVPAVSKIVLNTGVKDAINDSKVLNGIKDIFSKVAGQCAVRTYAKKSIAGFKLRKGVPIGVMVTLRGKRMYNFLDKLINVAIPGVRDFHGVTTNFDGNGNYNLGLKDWMVFSEVDYEEADKVRGLNVVICTTSSDDKQAYALLESLNMPFNKDKN